MNESVDWARYGLSNATAAQWVARFDRIIEGSGEMLTRRSAEIASYCNTPHECTFSAVGMALCGKTEPLGTLGIVVPATRSVMERCRAIIEQTAALSGEFR